MPAALPAYFSDAAGAGDDGSRFRVQGDIVLELRLGCFVPYGICGFYIVILIYLIIFILYH